MVEDGAGALRDGGKRIVRQHHRETCLLGKQLVETAEVESIFSSQAWEKTDIQKPFRMMF